MKRIISLMLTLIFVSALFASCGNSSAAGTYTLESVGGKTPFEWYSKGLSGEVVEGLLDLLGTSKEELSANFYILTLENDGKAKIHSEYEALFNEEGALESEGVWTLDGDVLTVTVNGKDVIMTFKNGVLTRDFDGDEGVFRKN